MPNPDTEVEARVDMVTRVPPSLREDFNRFARGKKSTANREAEAALRLWMLLHQQIEEVRSDAISIDALIGQATV